MSPRIHDYTADVNPSGPLDLRQAREADTGGVGNALANLGNTVSQVGQQIHQRDAQSEVSDLTADMAQAHADLTTGLADTIKSADPSDPNVASKFMDQYDEKMGDIGDNLETPEAQRTFAKMNASMRGQFQIGSTKAQAALAGENAAQNYNTTVSSYSTSLVNDPTQFDSVIAQNASSIDALKQTHNIAQNDADGMQDESETKLAQNALQGWINPTGMNSPETAIALLKAGKFDDYLDGDEKTAAIKEAETGVGAKTIEANRRQSVQDQVSADQIDQTQNSFLQKLNNNTLSNDDIFKSNLPAFGSGSKEQFLKMIDAQTAGPNETDSDTFHNLTARVFAPDGDPKKITDPNVLNTYIASGDLSVQDGKMLRAEIQKTPEGKREQQLKANFLKVAQANLVKPDALGVKDPQGQESYQAFTSDFLPAYDKARAGGATAQQLLDPNSPQYMGNMIRPYVKSPQQKMNAMAQSMNFTNPPKPGPTVEQRKPGETISQYLSRTSK